MEQKNNKSRNILASLSEGKKSSWSEEAKWRKENRDWLNISATIAMQIHNILEIRKWNQKRFAEELDVTPQHVSKILSGKENLTLKTIAQIQNCLGITLDVSDKISIDKTPVRDTKTYTIKNRSFKSTDEIKQELCLLIDIENSGVKTPQHKAYITEENFEYGYSFSGE